MCKDCGCQMANDRSYYHSHGDDGHHHSHDHDHDHDHHHNESKTVDLEMDILHKNDEIARRNRKWFNDHGIRVVNLISSPGSGKTMLLEKTLELLQDHKGINVAILVGDQEKDFDAKRLLEKGGKVKQLNTLSSCHLDASMIEREIGDFVDESLDLLIIENVGNLVCPASFDLGEHQKIALLSTTEGEDKPAKYPVLFHNANLAVITKIDLIPHLDWDLAKCKSYIRQVNPGISILETSGKTGEGVDTWVKFLL